MKLGDILAFLFRRRLRRWPKQQHHSFFAR